MHQQPDCKGLFSDMLLAGILFLAAERQVQMQQSVKPTMYMLRIHAPDDKKTPWQVFVSTTPFLAVSKGDIINPEYWMQGNSTYRIRVTSVEHILNETEDYIGHTISIQTEESTSAQSR
jgi:hypothetical protein